MKKIIFLLILVSFCKKPTEQKVYFLEPKDGAELKSPVKFMMKAEGVEVAPAGEVKLNSGHHHILINTDSIPEGMMVPFVEKKTYHFGKAQTEAEINLEKGEYEVELQFANGAHISYGPKLSSKIKFKVVE